MKVNKKTATRRWPSITPLLRRTCLPVVRNGQPDGARSLESLRCQEVRINRSDIEGKLANLVRQGQAQKQLIGRATDDAVALGVALEGEGTGHWVVPLGSPDPAAPGELVWSLSLDVGYEVSPGRHRCVRPSLFRR